MKWPKRNKVREGNCFIRKSLWKGDSHGLFSYLSGFKMLFIWISVRNRIYRHHGWKWIKKRKFSIWNPDKKPIWQKNAQKIRLSQFRIKIESKPVTRSLSQWFLDNTVTLPYLSCDSICIFLWNDQQKMQMPSHDKYLINMLFGAFHRISRIYNPKF